MRLNLQGKQLNFSILPSEQNADPYWANLAVSVTGEGVEYQRTGRFLTRSELRVLLVAMRWLLNDEWYPKATLSFVYPCLKVTLIPSGTANLFAHPPKPSNPEMELLFVSSQGQGQKASDGCVSVRLSKEETEAFRHD